MPLFVTIQRLWDCSEAKSMRVHVGAGVGRRVGGVFVGAGGGVSDSIQSVRKVDDGRLVLTNLRLVFDGVKENRSIALSKIMKAEPSVYTIEVDSESRQKSMTFSVENPAVLSVLIQLLRQGKDWRNIPKITPT
jgi:hypothetical protein